MSNRKSNIDYQILNAQSIERWCRHIRDVGRCTDCQFYAYDSRCAIGEPYKNWRLNTLNLKE